MSLMRFILNVAGLVALVGYAVVAQSELQLAMAIASLLVLLSAFFIMVSLPQTRWWLTLGQLILVVVVALRDPVIWFTLPLVVWNGVAAESFEWWTLVAFGSALLVGSWQLSQLPLVGWYGGWCLFLVALTWAFQRQEQRHLQLLKTTEHLRRERNHYATLFQQGVDNANVRESQAAAVERQRLVHEIHDQLGHQLTGSLMQLQAAKISYRTDPKQGEVLLDHATAIVRQGITDIRQILHTEQLAQETVNVDRLKGQLQQFADQYHFKTQFLYSGELTVITALQWRVFAANLQESLTNTLKYSQASNVVVTVRVYPTFIRLTVQNDGQAAPNYQPGLGLAGMAERTASLGGQLLVDGQTGFTVTTNLPRESHEKSHGS